MRDALTSLHLAPALLVTYTLGLFARFFPTEPKGMEATDRIWALHHKKKKYTSWWVPWHICIQSVHLRDRIHSHCMKCAYVLLLSENCSTTMHSWNNAKGWKDRKEKRMKTILSTSDMSDWKVSQPLSDNHSSNLSTLQSCHSNTFSCQLPNLGNAFCIIWWSLSLYETQMANCIQKEWLSPSVPTTTI